jgi:hypothetical protein
MQDEIDEYWATTERIKPVKAAKHKTQSTLTEDDIESAVIRGNLSVSLWKSIFPVKDGKKPRRG